MVYCFFEHFCIHLLAFLDLYIDVIIAELYKKEKVQEFMTFCHFDVGFPILNMSNSCYSVFTCHLPFSGPYFLAPL